MVLEERRMLEHLLVHLGILPTVVTVFCMSVVLVIQMKPVVAKLVAKLAPCASCVAELQDPEEEEMLTLPQPIARSNAQVLAVRGV